MTEPSTSTTPDFTKRREPLRFKLGGVEYVAPPIVSSVILRKVMALNEELKAATDGLMAYDLIGEMLALLVTGQHGEEIKQRLTASEDDPIDLHQEALPAFEWLISQCSALRPTKRSSPSANGSTTPTDPNEPTSTTAGASPEASTNEPSTQPTG